MKIWFTEVDLALVWYYHYRPDKAKPAQSGVDLRMFHYSTPNDPNEAQNTLGTQAIISLLQRAIFLLLPKAFIRITQVYIYVVRDVVKRHHFFTYEYTVTVSHCLHKHLHILFIITMKNYMSLNKRMDCDLHAPVTCWTSSLESFTDQHWLLFILFHNRSKSLQLTRF